MSSKGTIIANLKSALEAALAAAGYDSGYVTLEPLSLADLQEGPTPAIQISPDDKEKFGDQMGDAISSTMTKVVYTVIKAAADLVPVGIEFNAGVIIKCLCTCKGILGPDVRSVKLIDSETAAEPEKSSYTAAIAIEIGYIFDGKDP